MDLLERVLTERADELAEKVRSRSGLTRGQASRLVEHAGKDLLASYRWQENELSRFDLDAPHVTRDLLEGIRARSIADRLGVSPRQAWEGLRALVPAVVESAAEFAERSKADRSAGGDRPAGRGLSTGGDASGGEGSSGPRPASGGQGPVGTDVSGPWRFHVGFGLFFEPPGHGASITDAADSRHGGFQHPIFDPLLLLLDRPTG